MNENQSIKETLDVIRKALEEDDVISDIQQDNDNVLVLNQLVKDDGTINIINKDYITTKDTINRLENKLDEVFENYLSKWLDQNMPNYLEKYFKKKNI